MTVQSQLKAMLKAVALALGDDRAESAAAQRVISISYLGLTE